MKNKDDWAFGRLDLLSFINMESDINMRIEEKIKLHQPLQDGETHHIYLQILWKRWHTKFEYP